MAAWLSNLFGRPKRDEPTVLAGLTTVEKTQFALAVAAINLFEACRTHDSIEPMTDEGLLDLVEDEQTREEQKREIRARAADLEEAAILFSSALSAGPNGLPPVDGLPPLELLRKNLRNLALRFGYQRALRRAMAGGESGGPMTEPTFKDLMKVAYAVGILAQYERRNRQ
jgi:hypothetical protein